MDPRVQGSPRNAVVLSAFLVAACVGAVDEDTPGGGDGHGGSDSQTDDSIGPDDPPPGTGDPSVLALQCDKPDEVAPGAAPLRRLTNAQYRNTLRDLFTGITTAPDVPLPPDNVVSGYDNNASGQTSSLALLEGYEEAARTAASKAVSGSLQAVAPCANPTTGASACGKTFITGFGRRVFRRPLTTAETDRLHKLFTTTLGGSDYATAIRITMQALLMAPQFVFRFEEGSGEGTAAVALSGYEVASRLSYLLWDSMPDDDLFAAADEGRLDSVDGIKKAAERLLASDRARESVARFHRQWLHLSKLDNLVKDQDTFPFWNDDVAASLRTSLERYVDRGFWEQGKLGALLTDRQAFVDEHLAPLYEVDSPGEMALVDVDHDGTRAGLLTQAGLMAGLAKQVADSPVHRGLFVTESLLCETIPNAPPDVPLLADPAPGDPPATSRQRHEQSHSPPACAACHTRVDAIGFAFGNYDATGRYKTHEGDIPIDTTGELTGTRDVDGPFENAVELAQRLSRSTQVQQCVATNWFRYSFGRTEDESDDCALKPIVDDFIKSRGDLKRLLLTLVTSDAFRHRRQ